MSLTPFKDILALAEPSVVNEAKQMAKKNFADTLEWIDAMALSTPDDKEELEEEQMDWCNRWHQALVRCNISRGRSSIDFNR